MLMRTRLSTDYSSCANVAVRRAVRALTFAFGLPLRSAKLPFPHIGTFYTIRHSRISRTLGGELL